jgi:hypothetical protein
LNTPADYSDVLCNGQWKTAVPGREDPVIFSNYTQGLLFSMGRLSLNPYTLKRFNLLDKAPFPIDDSIVLKHAALLITFQGFQLSGDLFAPDHSYEAKYPKTNRYGTACTALFFIHQEVCI